MTKGRNIKVNCIKRKGNNMERLEYEVKYPNLTVNQLVRNRDEFNYEVIEAYILQYNKGFKVKEVGKTYRSGTIFTYEKISGEEEMEEYKKVIMELIKNYNQEHDRQISFEDF